MNFQKCSFSFYLLLEYDGFVHSNVIICNIHLHSHYRNMEQFCIFSIIDDNFSKAIRQMSLFFLLLVFLNFLLPLNPKEKRVSFL